MRHAAPHAEPVWARSFRISGEPQPNDAGPVALARQIAARLHTVFGFAPEALVFRQSELNPVLRVPDYVEFEFVLSGNRIVLASEPNPIEPMIRDYGLIVNGRPVAYTTTLMRPAADLIAEAAHRAIMPSAARHRPYVQPNA
ncbi:hypothetical protein AB0M46_13515 [Dactylosporangium sp. NPDC051485]|uniref:hypothetical protein n=1 Tax=Dactylosporangium sp. NPDC051485 TaxID=3154846 RepID=UPI0034438AF6